MSKPPITTCTKSTPPIPDSVRIPNKKRGRPKKKIAVHRYMADRLGSRNQADMIAGCQRLEPQAQEVLLPLADQGKTTPTVLAYLSRFPAEQQQEMFPLFNRLGSRAAKRFWECLTRPPSREQMAKRVHGWLMREYPSLALARILDALEGSDCQGAREHGR